MTQQNLVIGAADAGLGEDYFSAFTKTEANFTELFGVVASLGIVFVKQESDFPVQDATTITLESQTQYIITATFSTAKSFTVKDAAVLTSSSTLGPVLTYTGTGSMFNITDASFVIRLIRIDHPNAQAFNFVDSVGGTFLFLSDFVRHLTGTKYGTFSNPQTVLITQGAAFSMGAGVTITGSNVLIISFDKFFINSTSSSFKGIDLNSAVAQTIEFSDVIVNGPAGAFALSGLANNGNIPVGRLAMVDNCEFGGGLTPLENITNSDTRWNFSDNTPIPDTIADGLLSLTANATATVIATVDTPVLVAGTFVVERISLYTGTTAGRMTYEAERDLVTPIDISVQIEPVSGTNKDITVYLALNGTIITNSGKSVRADSGNPLVLGVIWQLNLSENDFLEIFVENNSDSVNILVDSAAFRAR